MKMYECVVCVSGCMLLAYVMVVTITEASVWFYFGRMDQVVMRLFGWGMIVHL